MLGTRIAIEARASNKVGRNDVKGLKYLKEEGVFQNLILVSQDPISALTGNIMAIPWQKFLSDLWRDKFV
jgi:predicted AAA+ superfamily ATPase